MVGILIFMSRINFVLGWVEHKKFHNLGAWSRGYKIFLHGQLIFKDFTISKVQIWEHFYTEMFNRSKLILSE